MIEITDDFFPEDLAQSLHERTMWILDRKSAVFSTNLWWNEKLRKGNPTPPVILIHNLIEFQDPLCNKIVRYIGTVYPDLEVVGILFHIFTPGSYIGEHRDGGVDRTHALTIYLNSLEWSVDKGGLLLYNDPINEESGTVVPKYNRAVLLSGDVYHEVTPNTSTNLRRTLQLWLKQRD